jgi:hypothetical protein
LTLGNGSVNIKSNLFATSEIQHEPVDYSNVKLMHRDGSQLLINVGSGQIGMQGSQPSLLSYQVPPTMNILQHHKEQILLKLEERKEEILRKKRSRAVS